jgi:hypothetical protein
MVNGSWGLHIEPIISHISSVLSMHDRSNLCAAANAVKGVRYWRCVCASGSLAAAAAACN